MLKSTDVRSVNLSAVTDLTEIEAYSFRSQDYRTEFSKLEEVYLPESVTKIGQSAFEGSLIQKITTPGVEVLGEAAFKNCEKLKSITLNKLTGILPSYSFENCIEMASAYMPKITEIAEYAFKSAGLQEGIQGHGEQWRSQPSEAKAAMAQPCELLPNDGAAESNPKPSEAMATPFHNHAERWRSRVPRKTGLMLK